MPGWVQDHVPLPDGGREVEIRIKVAAVWWRSASLTGACFIKSSCVVGVKKYERPNESVALKFVEMEVYVAVQCEESPVEELCCYGALDDMHPVMKVDLSCM